MESKSGESGHPCLVSDLRGHDFRFSTLNMLLLSRFSHVRLFTTPWTIDHQAPLSMGFSRQEYWSGFHALLQGIFPTQESKLRLFGLLHWQVGSLLLVPSGKAIFHVRNLERILLPSDMGCVMQHFIQVWLRLLRDDEKITSSLDNTALT